MTRYQNKITMRPPTWRQRIGHWMTGVRSPALEGPEPVPGYDWARMVPYALRSFHEGYATEAGLSWRPCVLCGRPFGGHEHGGAVPDPCSEGLPEGASMWIRICSLCTWRGRAVDRD